MQLGRVSRIEAGHRMLILVAVILAIMVMAGQCAWAQVEKDVTGPGHIAATGDGPDHHSASRPTGEPQPIAVPPSKARPLHIVPFLGGQTIRQALPGLFAPPGTHMTYFGGPVITNVHVVQVLYGTGNYLPNVSSTAPPSVASFFTDVTQGSYFDMLSEYSTQGLVASDGGPSSNQFIGHGFFDGQFSITPSAANNGSTITDNQIQTELLSQVNAGNLPAPVLDAQGNNNTLYMVYFPSGKTISLAPGLTSCARGGFCAYHNSTVGKFGSRSLFYGVLPDMQAPSACSTGCGSTSPFDNVTIVSSHELSEAVSDADVGNATAAGRPLAWVDLNTGAEIGDVCAGLATFFSLNNGIVYSVQQEWSNLMNECVGGPMTYFFDLPFEVTPGAKFSMTVNASTGSNVISPSSNYRGTVHFTSSDPAAVLPTDYTYTFADAGSHTFIATLNGTGTQTITVSDTQFPFSGTVTRQIQPPPSAARFLIRTPANANVGSPVSLALEAVDAFFDPAPNYNGTVHFSSSDAAAVLPPDTAVINGNAVFPATLNTAGFGQTVTVADVGTPSISGQATFNVFAAGADSTTISVTASPNPSAFGEPVLYTATVTGGTVPLNGNVGFAGVASGTLDATGHAQASVLLGPGTRTVFAEYSGTNKPSSSAPFIAIVNPAPISVILSASQSAGTLGDPITFTAALSSTLNASLVSTIPQSGSITLNDGGTPFAVLFAPVINGAAGVAFTTSQLTTGQHAITATFSGNTGFASATSPALAQVVNPAGSPDFSLIPNATSASVSAGQAADFSFNAKSLNGFTGILKFSCGNLPALTTCTFSPATEFVVTAGTNFTTLVVKTTGPHAALVAPALPGNSRGLGAYAALWGWTPFACGIVLLAGFRRKRFGSRAVVLLALISIGILGCGGGGTPAPPPPPIVQATPAGTSNISVIATATPASGLSTQTTKQFNLSLTVQ